MPPLAIRCALTLSALLIESSPCLAGSRSCYAYSDMRTKDFCKMVARKLNGADITLEVEANKPAEKHKMPRLVLQAVIPELRGWYR